MKIIKTSELRPTYLIEPTYQEFILELEALSNKLGVAVATTGGIVMFDVERDKVRYERNPCSGNLEPVITEIEKIKTAASNTTFDFQAFSDELKQLFADHDLKIVSLGAMSGQDDGGDGVTYLAIWRSGSFQ